MATTIAMTAMNGIKSTNDVRHDNPFAELASLLSRNPEVFLQPTLEIQQAAIHAAKIVLDPLAKDVADAQLARRSETRRKRKRGDDDDEEPILQLRQVYTKGFGVKQVWEQAKRVLDSACFEVNRELALQNYSQHGRETLLEQGAEDDDVSLDGDEATDDLNGALDSDLQDDIEHEDMEDDVGDASELDGEDDVEEPEDIKMGSDVDLSSSEESSGAKEIFVPDKHGLNDGFFSIDDFNKQSQFLEQMDARGDEDNPSDEDDIDWAADPLSMSFTKPKPGRQNGIDDEQDDEEEGDEDGPTFADAGLEFSEEDASMDGDAEGLEDSMGMSNANDVRYTDFFEPPPKKPSKTKRMRALPKTQPTKEPRADQNDEQTQNDIERAMADVRRDLLDSDEEEEEELSDEEDESSDELGPRKPKQSTKNLSTHEKQRAVIAAEIRQLEAANVAKRDWQLSGEARAADRPLNSLIEEDFEFERAGKPVPVITAETSEEIEQLIKRRILAREFDEVIRRQPGSINSATETKRGRIELDDTKPQLGLGQIYEQEHLQKADPLTYTDNLSSKTKTQHQQIDLLWSEINSQLNALSNLHFKPKRLDLELKTVQDKPRIAMEDARPVGDSSVDLLAPQEIYRPGVDTQPSRDEISLGRSGATLNKEELTREEKTRRRRREKERNKKSSGNKEQVVLGRTKKPDELKGKKGGKVKEQDKADIISDLKKGNVKVIGKGGELQNIEKGKKERGLGVGSGDGVIASNYKL